MAGFNEWWSGLSLFVQVMYLIAIPSSLLLVVQTVLLAIGAAHGGGGDLSNPSDVSGLDMHGDVGHDGVFGDVHDGSADVHGCGHDAHAQDGSPPHDFSIASLFTLQGVTSFLCVFGWVGALLASGGVPAIIAGLVAFALGFLAMFGIAKLVRLSAKLAYDGTLNINGLLGETGTVYLKIPSKGNGQGKVTVQSGERLTELEAVSEEEAEIPSGTIVRVVDIIGGNVLVVERDVN